MSKQIGYFKNLEAEIDGFRFFFDVSKLEHKKANEKREIIYEFKEKRNDGVIVFNVSYSEKGKTTKIDEILKALKKEGIKITEEILEKAFRVFERQIEEWKEIGIIDENFDKEKV